MKISRQSAKSQIEKLVHFFDQNIHQFKSSSFNETQARQQLIDPFFEALGWDITNREMKPLYLQEVIPEGRVKTNIGKEVREQTVMFDGKETLGKQYKEYSSILDYIAEDEYKASTKEATKKPDYRFRIKGQTKFFVEAKKPFVDLSKNQDAIFQVKRYGFSGRVPVSILTDFEQFRVFDCTHKPLYEKPKLGIIKEFDLTYAQYHDEFDSLYDTFSRDAVEAGSLDTLTKKLLQKKTGDFALDKTFLDDLSKWREELARDIAKHPRNRRQLNDYTLNESVQRILDRIVFFRVCEDREIEVENTLLAVLQMWKSRPGVSLYSLLNDLFKLRRTLYNGLLFSPHECEALEVGDDVLVKILQNLNYPFSPYHFNEIGVEILGSIYEKFLGKTIHLAKKNVIVSEKPEVRKAGGVYYTPQYIVNYIVDNTLGKLLSPAPPPKQVAKLKIIDIACGSGSFLLGAFQKLIDYHIEWYMQHPKDIQTISNVPDAHTDVNGNLRLSSRKKRDILVNNIYGVDIDRQAVEVTQMSLYLKVLENENAETLNPQMTLALKQVYLPELTKNIKCGNSLIGTDFGVQAEIFDNGSRMKINPFDWEMEFAEIMKNGGFDCVIGNPPYATLTLGKKQKSEDKQVLDYYKEKYPEASEYKINTFALFISKALKLIIEKGHFSFIVPSTFYTNVYFTNLRREILQKTDIKVLCELRYKVFEDAEIGGNSIFVFRKGYSKNNVIQILQGDNFEDFVGNRKVRQIEQSTLLQSPDYRFLFDISISNLLRKISINSTIMDKVATFYQGIITGDNKKYLSNKKVNDKWKKILRGKDIDRYRISWPKQYVLFDRSVLWSNADERMFYVEEKLISRQTSDHLAAVYDDQKYLSLDSTHVIIPRSINSKYLLGIFNSRLVNFCYQQLTPEAGRAFAQVKIVNLKKLPIRIVDLTVPKEKKQHDDLIAYVDKMLEFHNQLTEASFDSEKEPIERQIKATDQKIDQLVYQLYGLTEEEIKVVEGEGSH